MSPSSHVPSREPRLRRLTTWSASAVLAGLAVLAAPAAAPAAPGAYTDTTRVTAVEIPVQVVREGKPVRGLTAADFEVFDDKTRQAITGFDVFDLSLPAARALSTPIPAAARRHLLLLFDLAFSSPNSIARARDAAREVVVKQVVPSDLVAVATYSPASGPHLALGFTSDRRQIAQAIDSLGLAKLVDRSPDPLRLMAEQFKSEVEVNSQQRIGQRGAFAVHDEAQQYMALALKEEARKSESASRESQIAEITSLARSFADLARLMANVAGRKQVIYLSEGFQSSLLEGAETKGEQDSLTDSIVYGQSYDVDNDTRYGNTRGNNQMAKMLESFRRSDCVIQAIDIGGLRGLGDPSFQGGQGTGGHGGSGGGPAMASGEATLFEMAHDTGGELYRNFNDLGAAMSRLLDETSVTYLLTIQPASLASDGRYHPLRVELKNPARGVKVAARSGYYAPIPFAKESQLARSLTVADALMSGPRSGSVDLAVLAAPFRGKDAKSYVPVVIEADGATLLSGMDAAAADLPAEIYVYAVDAEGQIQDYFDQAMRFDLGKATALHQGGLRFFGHLELPAGSYWLRVLVRNGLTGAYGMRATALRVPAFEAARPELLPPFFPDAPGRWLTVREQPRGSQRDAAYPFMMQNRAFIPASRPDFAPGREVAVALVGYNLGPHDQLVAHVLAADGRDMGAAPLTVAEREAGEDGAPARLRASCRLPAQLPPGEYQLVISLAEGGAAAGAPGRTAVAAPTSTGSFAVVAAVAPSGR